MRLRLITTSVLTAFLSLPCVAHATEYYTLVSNSSLDSFTYVFAEPAILTTTTTILPGSLLSSSGEPTTGIRFNPTTQDCGSPFSPNPAAGNCVIVDDGVGAYFTLSVGPTLLNAEGVYPLYSSLTGAQFGSITISPTLTAATPEPASFLLLGSGLLGLAGAVRRRLA